jgi:predicted DNA-binding transcriptional regulator AlpA
VQTASLPPSTLPQLFHLSQVARSCNVCDRTLKEWVKKGEFPPPIRIRGRLYWTQEVVQAWLQNRLTGDDASQGGAV